MRRNLFLFLLLAAFLAVATQVGGMPLNADDDPTEGASYVGEAKCKKCHLKVHRGWKKQKHFAAWENLPAEFRDASKKDDQGRSCISCHTTGYGQGDRGGFTDVEKSAHLLGVQCEACHGPGSKHVVAAGAIMKEKRKEFKAGEKSFIQPKTAACANCHNPHLSYTKKYGGG